MELIAYTGPMWSGKTTALMSFFQQATNDRLKVGIFDHPENKRGSCRDLSLLCANVQTFDSKVILDQSWDVLIFDEVHLYDCFQDSALFLNTVKQSFTKVVVMAGIHYDFYHEYHVFPIWTRLSMLGCEFRNCYSVVPCSMCGMWQGVQYTVSTGDPAQRVGDCYQNVCRSCGIKYLVEWKNKINKAAIAAM